MTMADPKREGEAAAHLLGAHRVGQAASGLVDAPRDRALAAFLNHRGLAVRETLKRDEDHARAHLDRQRVEGADQPSVRLAKLRLDGRVVARVDMDRELDAEVVHRLFAAALAIAARVERAVHGHAIDPREELAAALERRERAVRAEEHVLRDVVGLGARAGEVQRERVDALAVTTHQRLEGAGVARLGQRHQVRRRLALALGIGHRHQLRRTRIAEAWRRVRRPGR